MISCAKVASDMSNSQLNLTVWHATIISREQVAGEVAKVPVLISFGRLRMTWPSRAFARAFAVQFSCGAKGLRFKHRTFKPSVGVRPPFHTANFKPAFAAIILRARVAADVSSLQFSIGFTCV